MNQGSNKGVHAAAVATAIAATRYEASAGVTNVYKQALGMDK